MTRRILPTLLHRRRSCLTVPLTGQEVCRQVGAGGMAFQGGYDLLVPAPSREPATRHTHRHLSVCVAPRDVGLGCDTRWSRGFGEAGCGGSEAGGGSGRKAAGKLGRGEQPFPFTVSQKSTPPATPLNEMFHAAAKERQDVVCVEFSGHPSEWRVA